MATASPRNECIYNIVIACDVLFDNYFNLLSNVKTVESPNQSGQTGSKNDQATKDSKTTSEPRTKDEDERKAKMEVIRRDFDLWINYTGALATVGRSLDDRLGADTDIKEMVLELLEMLDRNLQYICSRETEGINVFYSQSLETEAWMATKQSIDDLHFMAAVIRRSSVQSENYDLLSRFETGDELLFGEFAKGLVKREFPNARRSLCEQLGASIAVRRKKLLRRKLHEEKLGERRQDGPVKLRQQPTVSASQSSVFPSEGAASTPLPFQRLKNQDNRHTGSDNTRSKFDGAAARGHLKAGPSRSTTSMGSSIRNPDIVYPDMPQISGSSGRCTCPYCAKPLVAEKLQKYNNYWKDHIDEDLRPYVCLSEECTSPFLFFVHMHEWLDHMKTIHSDEWNRKIHMNTWYCDIDHDNEEQFNDYPSFVSHMKDATNHPKRPTPTDLQVSALSRNKQNLILRDEYCCPLCDCIPFSMEPVIRTGRFRPNDVKIKLNRHIGDHVKTLAFRSIPIPDHGTKSVANFEDEDRRCLRDGSTASHPSGYDSDIRAISLSFIEDPQSPDPDINEDDFGKLSIPRESYLDESFNDYMMVEMHEVPAEEDRLLAHLARIQDTSTTARGNVHWMVPAVVNYLFTGRADLLLRMRKALHSNHTSLPDEQKRFVLTGLGGQGKSEICLKFASLMREEFWGVFWVDVTTPSTAESGFIAVAKKLDCLVENVADALRVLANAKQPWLLILDNADDPGFNYEVYLPSGTHGAIIITSRVNECRKYHTVGAEAIEGLKNQDSQELLLKATKLPQESWLSYTSEATEVLHLLGSHTLALIQAGAYIARGHCKLHEYPKVFQQYRKQLMGFSPSQAQSTYGSVYTTFEASADVLKQSKSEVASDALQLLEILSMLDSSVLPLQIFQEESDIDLLTTSHVLQLPAFIIADSDEWNSYRLTEAAYLLASLSLVTQHDLDGSPGLSMHPLTHAWAKDRQDSEKQDMAWIATGCVLALSRFNIHIWRTQERRLLPHIQSFLDSKINRAFSLGPKAIVIPILLKCGWTLLDMRQDSKLGRLLKDIFVELGKKPEELSKEFLPLYDLQARSLVNLGHNKRAVELLEQVVKIKEATLAEDHPSRLASQHELAIAYQANGQVKEAVELLEQVVKIEEATLAEDHPSRLASQHADTLTSVSNLGSVLESQGNYEEAEHPNTLTSVNNLGSVLSSQGKYEEAEAMHQRALEGREKVLGVEHPQTLTSVNSLGSVLLSQGKYEEAEAKYQRALEGFEKVLGVEHPDTLIAMNNLAFTLKSENRNKEAISLMETCFQLQDGSGVVIILTRSLSLKL
ncbi:hypothetical protein VE00_10598 [Pseudogymnoascus sp. WSF 3629]|nr:hypothetical protein VE00_10598 [Pseudogymnoascus sp. WSF 3629]